MLGLFVKRPVGVDFQLEIRLIHGEHDAVAVFGHQVGHGLRGGAGAGAFDDGIEAETVGQRHGLLLPVRLHRVDAGVRAAFEGDGVLAFDDVADDDQRRAGLAGELRGVETDGTCAGDEHAAAEMDADGLAGVQRNGQRLGLRSVQQGDVVGNLIDLRHMPADVFGHAVEMRFGMFTEVFLSGAAEIAGVAEVCIVGGDAVADLQSHFLGLVAEIFDDAGDLMSHVKGEHGADGRFQLRGQVAADDVRVGAADRGIGNADEDIFGAGRGLFTLEHLHLAGDMLGNLCVFSQCNCFHIVVHPFHRLFA